MWFLRLESPGNCHREAQVITNNKYLHQLQCHYLALITLQHHQFQYPALPLIKETLKSLLIETKRDHLLKQKETIKRPFIKRKETFNFFMCYLVRMEENSGKNVHCTVDISINCQSLISKGVQHFINMFFFNFLHNFVVHIIKDLKILILT